MFAQGLGIRLCPCHFSECSFSSPSSCYLCSFDPLSLQNQLEIQLFFSALMFNYNPSIKSIYREEGSMMDGLELVKRSQKRKWTKIEVKESEANVLSSWQRYFRKMSSNLNGVKVGLAFYYKIKAIF